MSDDYKLSKEDFEKIEWQKAIEGSEKKDCHQYWNLFFSKAEEAKNKSDHKAQRLFSLFGDLASLALRSESATEPFGPMMVLQNSRSAILDDFEADELSVLAEIVPDISDAEMRARIADVLWIKKRGFRMAQVAVDAYLQAGIILEDPENWPAAFHRIERAMRLAAMLGANAGNLDRVLSHVEAILDKYDGNDPLFFSARLMEILIEFRKGDSTKYASLSGKIALCAETDSNWYKARSYRELEVKWYALAKDEERRKRALKCVAETYVKEAEAAIVKESPRYLVASSHLQSAIEVYRRVGGEEERINKLHKTLLIYQKESLKEMMPFSTNIDLSKAVQNAINHVKGKSLYDGIFSLAFMAQATSVKDLKERVEEATSKFHFQHLFSSTVINEQGKVIARKPGLSSIDQEEIEASKKAEMFSQAKYNYFIYTQGCIEPAKYQLNLEHNIQIRDFSPLVTNNILVPEGREYIYAYGLHAGMIGDYLVSAHLLIPQIENSIRHILSLNGVITSKLTSKGIQDECRLDEILTMSETKEFFGEDIIFDLQGLLTERWGANL